MVGLSKLPRNHWVTKLFERIIKCMKQGAMGDIYSLSSQSRQRTLKLREACPIDQQGHTKVGSKQKNNRIQ